MAESRTSIVEQLKNVQVELKAPKGQKNTFGNYMYRSCEDILESVKPLLKKYGLCLLLSDEIVEVGGRIYVKATARIMNEEGGCFSTTAYAREEETKKGMDASQVTGSSSSYARKYALNGLLCIDDTKDADTDEQEKTTKGAKQKAKAASTEQPAPLVCANCSQEVVDRPDWGASYTAQAIAKTAMKNFKCVLCGDCLSRKMHEQKGEQA